MKSAIAALLSVFAIGVVAVYCFLKPLHCYDETMYIASAYSYEQAPAEVYARIHSYFLDVQRVSPPFRPEFTELSEDRMRQQLPFYTVKPIYVSAIWLALKAGLSPSKSGSVVSALSFFGCGIVLLLWFWRHLSPSLAAVAAFAVTIIPASIYNGRLFTPDAMSTCALLAATFALCEFSLHTGLLLLLVAIGVRPDNIVYSSLVLMSLVVMQRLSLAWGAVAGAVFLGAYFAINLHGHSHHDLMVNSFGQYSWTSLWLHGVSGEFISEGSLAALLLVFALRFPKNKTYFYFSIVTLVTLAVRYVLFPYLTLRYVAPYLLLWAVFGCIAIAPDRANTNLRFQSLPMRHHSMS